MKTQKKDKGITLIALVITIIVLLILASVSISMLTGENGIITQAQRAKEETEKAAREEERDLAELEAIVTGKDIVITPVHDENPGELEKEGSDTFVINSIEDLVFLSYDVTNGNTYNGKTVKLATNLDFSSDKSYVNPNRTDFGKYGYNGNLKQLLTTGEGFIPIGEIRGSDYENNTFYGTFDGNNNAICSLYENMNTNENIRVGLFSTNYGEIKNLGLINVDISVMYAGGGIGGITARSYNSIRNCYVEGNIKAEGNSWMPVGGISGAFCGNNAVVENCYNLANIDCKNTSEDASTANIVVGGIIAQIEGTNINIEECYNEGNIIINSKNVSIKIGGICGHLFDNGIIKNSYNAGGVNATCGNIGNSSVNVAGIVRCIKF